MQGIYTYIPETNHVPREYSVSVILSLLFMVPISLVPALTLLYFHVSTFRSMCAVPNMVVFCSSFTSWFPDMLLMYFLNDFEVVPVAPIVDLFCSNCYVFRKNCATLGWISLLKFHIIHRRNELCFILFVCLFACFLFFIFPVYRPLLFEPVCCAVSVFGHLAVDSAH